MATVKEIFAFLDNKTPFETQLAFDNSGFLAGRGEAEVRRVLVSLDITEEVAHEAAERGAQLIVSHHPVIFSPIKAVTDADVTGRILLALLEGGVAALCVHTNLDAAKGGVNDALAARLSLRDTAILDADGICRAGLLSKGEMPFSEFATGVRAALNAHGLRVVDCGRPVRKVAVGGGACAEYLADAVAAGCDVFVTGDVKYHTFLEAKALGIGLIDAGHYATEQVVCPVLEAWLRDGFPELEILRTECHGQLPHYV